MDTGSNVFCWRRGEERADWMEKHGKENGIGYKRTQAGLERETQREKYLLNSITNPPYLNLSLPNPVNSLPVPIAIAITIPIPIAIPIAKHQDTPPPQLTLTHY